MNEVIPTKPGWWWVSICGDPPIAKFVHMDDDGSLFIIRADDEERPLDSLGGHWKWLAPVPSVEAVQAAVEATMNACRKMEDAGWHPREGVELSNAIAGLTGEGE